ncbi:MAG: hypothetical protein J0I69_02715 [Altererythrobacter sp.]|nr:hypothetical protein [Altererythrobacter sp.]OJU60932.1 MAG: hypothetical protein BGO08_12465 [Altererythrobacter sp. 66-12]
MSLPDAAAAAAMDAPVLKPVWFVFMDFLTEPLRANSSGVDVTVSGSGQPDLDGEYIGVDPRLVSVSPVKVSPGGSDTVTARLSGIRGLDDDDRTLLADPANWQGRTVRMWRMIRNSANEQQGGIQHYYTGYMMALSHIGSAGGLTLELTIESYLAAFSQASGRTYLDQESFDELDLSARAALAIANGNSSSPLTSGAGGAGPRPVR